MSVNKKYAKLMYDYLLETLLEQQQYELYIYALTVLHTGLRTADAIELTWDQFKGNKFVNVKQHRQSSIMGKDVFEDIKVFSPQQYIARLERGMLKATPIEGKMFSFKSKYAITHLLRKHTGTLLFSHELRIFWSWLIEKESDNVETIK